MGDRVFVGLIVGVIICSAVSGGVAYAFGTAVVPGLGRTDPITAVTAWNGIISDAGSNPAFVFLLVVTAVLALAVGVLAARRLRQPGGRILLAAVGFVLIAGLITLLFIVPLNNGIVTGDPALLTPDDALREWHAFVEPWLAWNAVRCAAGLVGAALFAVGLWRSARGREAAVG